ncbi:hypothetical protein ARMSODRAFT_889401, partial [Armillaria solidipes]
VPLSESAVAAHVHAITGEEVGEHWVHGFQRAHPETKAMWISGQESLHAQALNKPIVQDFYNIFYELQQKYNIPKKNIYNMNEKGI